MLDARTVPMAGITRRMLLTLMIASGAATAGFGWARYAGPQGLWARTSDQTRALLWPGPRPAADCSMTAQDGQPWTAGKLGGQWTLAYFGYLSCPDVCPSTIAALAGMRKQAAAEGDAPAVLFVSVDPANDTPERIGPYLAHFDPALVGVAGTPEDTARLTRSLGVYYQEHIDANGTRTMDHTTSVIVIDPAGNGVAALTAAHDATLLLEQYRLVRRHFEG
jgi:protein SCO1/2